jgi:hypothetical protein
VSRYIDPGVKVTLSVGTLSVLAEYATSTDAEVDERGMADLHAVLAEVRPLIGWSPLQDYMEGSGGPDNTQELT